MTNDRTIAKVGVFVDVANIYSNGGQRMRFDVLRQYAQLKGMVQRLNAYVTYDAERARNDREYQEKTTNFHEILRDLGYHTTVKEVRWYYDADSDRRYGKANSDLDLGVDMLIQAGKLDQVILVTGDGDFVKVVQAVRDMGSRVEVIAFDNFSNALRKEADIFTNGYLIPGLVPVNRRDAPWGSVGSTVRGYCYYHHPEDSYGFLAFLSKPSADTWIGDPRHPDSPYKAAFFHDSNLPDDVNPNHLPNRRTIFEFELGQSDRGFHADNLRLAGSKTDNNNNNSNNERQQTIVDPMREKEQNSFNVVLGNSAFLDS